MASLAFEYASGPNATESTFQEKENLLPVKPSRAAPV